MHKLYENALLPTIGGFCCLIVVMGVGRFVYTAILPGMMHTYGFGKDVAGMMAAWNYAGYLGGVLAMRKETPGMRRYILFLLFLVLSLLTTALMGFVATDSLWYIIRFWAGFASGACFVLCSSIVLDTLVAYNRPVLAGLLYSGVGAGIAIGGIAAGILEQVTNTAGVWLGLATLCLPLAVVGVVTLRPKVNQAHLQSALHKIETSQVKNVHQRRYYVLLVSYFLEGFGYIIGATFLVVFVQDVTHSSATAHISWVVTGCAAAISTPLWRCVAKKGHIRMLVLAFTLQGIGSLLPVVSNSTLAALGGGLLLGGTFMGITVISLQYGVELSGKPSAHTVAVMTGLYGVGQIVGPIVAKAGPRGHSFSFIFIVSAASLFGAAIILLISNRKRQGVDHEKER